MRQLCLGIAFSALFAIGATRISAQTCGTTITGGLVSNTTWTVAGSPYCIAANINVSLLTIQPGVEVWLDPGVNIVVNTTITAVGTREAPILFTAANKDPLQRWGHISFTGTQPGSEFAHCRFELAGNSAMMIVNSFPTIRDSVFEGNISPGNGGALNVGLVSGDLVIDRCRIENNVAAVHGGGMSAAMTGTGKLILKNCTLRNNRATGGSGIQRVGGGVHVTGSSEILDCLFEENSVDFSVGDNGGGSLWTNGNCMMRRSTILSGSCTASGSARSFGGGIYHRAGFLDIRNSIIACNTISSARGRWGAGIYIFSGDAHFENSTIANNFDLQGVSGQGILVETATTTLTILNSIFWGNNGGANSDQIIAPGNTTVTYSDIQGGFPGIGNIAFNPGFAGPGCCVADLRIAVGSPCIDTGDPGMAFNDVLPGPPLNAMTPNGPRNDMGAYGGPGALPSLPQNADVYSFGEGCIGSAGVPALDNINFPVVGGSFSLTLSNLNPSQATAIGIIGLSRQCWTGTGEALPLDLEFLSMTGCELLVSPNLCRSIDSAGGVASWTLPIPSAPSLIGLEFFLQGISVDPGPNFIGLTMSNALDCRVGN